MIENTRDMSRFGYIELKEAARLLNAYIEAKKDILNDGVAIEFNPNSGNVFLVDEDYNVAMMNGDNLETWYTCPHCGYEGVFEDMKHEPEDSECINYMVEIGVIPKPKN